MLLGSCVPTVAQIPAVRIASTQEPLAPIATLVQMVPSPFLARASLLPEKPGKYADHFSYALAGAYESGRGLGGLETLSQMREIKALFITRSSLPLLNLWGGRLRFDGFTSTVDTHNVQRGPSAAGGLEDFRPPHQNYPGRFRSVDR